MINPFYNIKEQDKEELLRKLEAQTYNFKKNISILSMIKIRNLLGVIVKGTLLVIKTDYNGNRIIVEELNEDNIFGKAISYFINDDYEIVVKEDCQVILFDYYDIINYQNDETYYNQFVKNLLEIMYHIVLIRNERIRVLTQKTIRNKLLEYFDILSKKYRSRIIYLPSTFTDLADYLAVDRSAMMREIKRLKDERIITVKSTKITLQYK